MTLARLNNLTASLRNSKLDAVILNPGPTLTYLTGLQFHLMERPVVLFVTPGKDPVLVLPELELPKVDLFPYKVQAFAYGELLSEWDAAFRKAAQALGLDGKRIGVEPRQLRLLEFRHVKAGAPEGIAKDAPLPRKWASGWNIGKPDAIVQIPDTFRVPAQGVVAYKYSYAKTAFDEDKWITAMEIKPTANKAVHHVLVFIEEPGLKPANDRTRKPGEPVPQGGISGFFAATAPGSTGIVFPEGTGKRLPKGAWLKFQIHYQPNGVEQVDQTRIAFKFSDKPLEEVLSKSAFNQRFTIPPGDSHYEVKATHTFTQSGVLTTLFPHMHLRGSAFKYELQYPDGKTVPLLDVPRYDFNWQSYYLFKTPVAVPVGAKMLATAWYDNSEKNPFNPDATKSVRFGEQTYEEMMIGYFDFIADPVQPAVDSTKTAAPAVRPAPPPRR
jgi:hypothetical protein